MVEKWKNFSHSITMPGHDDWFIFICCGYDGNSGDGYISQFTKASKCFFHVIPLCLHVCLQLRLYLVLRMKDIFI